MARSWMRRPGAHGRMVRVRPMTPIEYHPERRTRVGEVELAHDAFGDPADPPVMMVMGIGAQLVAWPEGFCERLAANGLFVVRFDNRDAGNSSRLTELGTPSVTKAWSGELADPPYLLSDMAADVAGLIEALGHETAHVVGASLGGFVAQTLAIERPERVRSLTSIMSSTGKGSVGYPTQEALEVLMRPPAADRDGYVEGLVAARRVLGSPGFAFDDAWVRGMAAAAFDRGLNPEGTQRQLVASICSGDRTRRLAGVRVPTMVLHGTDDPLIHVSGGRATAEAIPGASLVEIAGWGHDLPPGLWDRIAGEIAVHVRAAEGAEDAPAGARTA